MSLRISLEGERHKPDHEISHVVCAHVESSCYLDKTGTVDTVKAVCWV